MNLNMIIIYFEIYAILALALNLQLGMTGLLNFSIGIFYAIGAYVFGIVVKIFGFSFFEALTCAIVVNVILSIPVSMAAVRFKGEIFVLVTLAIHIIGITTIGNLEITGGQFGLNDIPQYNFFGSMDIVRQYSIIGGILLFVVAAFSYLLYRLPFVRTLQTIRDDAVVAAALGKNIIIYKAQSVAISCGLTAFAGALLVSSVPVLTTDTFDLKISIDIILILVFGGLANTRGAILGAFFYQMIEHVFRKIEIGSWLNESLQIFNLSLKSNSIDSNLKVILFCVTLILLLYFRPQGLAGKLKTNNLLC